MRIADTIIVEIVNEPFRTAMVGAVTAEPSVAAVAASWPNAPVDRPRAAFGSSADSPGRSPVGYRFVTPRSFSVLDIGVLRGRTFTEAEASSNAAVAVVSEATARQIWPNGDAVGQVLRLEPDPDSETRRRDEPTLPSQTFIVVGVVRDVAGFRIAGYSEAGVYVPTSQATAETALIARVHGDLELVRRALLEPHEHRSQHGTGDDHANAGQAGDIPPAGRVLADGRTRRAGTPPDLVRHLQRVVVPRRNSARRRLASASRSARRRGTSRDWCCGSRCAWSASASSSAAAWHGAPPRC